MFKLQHVAHTLAELAGFTVICAAPAAGQSSWVEEAKLTAGSPAYGDNLGGAAALSGDTAVVGAQGGNAAYVWARSGGGWVEEAVLLASAGASSDRFGSTVSVSGDTVAVGASAGQVIAGAAYVYVRTGTNWTEQARLSLVEAPAYIEFGYSVAVEEDTLLVGAIGADGATADSGAVFAFARSGSEWVKTQRLTAADSGRNDIFGVSIALSGDTALIGASLNDEAGSDGGAAYVFRRSGSLWVEEAKLIGSDTAGADTFGEAVALSGDTALVGAGRHNALGANSGAAYVFRRSGSVWSEQAKLLASDGSSGDLFGGSVSMEADLVLVGALANVAPGFGAGSAYVFRRSGTSWTEEVRLMAGDVEDTDHFGTAVALSGGTALVGSPSHDLSTYGSSEGAAYVFADALLPVTYCTAGRSASGCRVLLAATGTASATAASGFTLTGAAAEGGRNGLFFFGVSGRQASPWGTGTSFQCVVPPVTRTDISTSGGTPGACDGSFTRDLNATWCPTCPAPSKNPGAGAVAQAQLWYRDPLNTSNQTTSLSDAVEFGVGP